jgi:hypothetical protein
MATTGFELHRIASSLRFIQGYRFLDRCGEAIIKLEEVLDEGWIPGETNPGGGVLVNHVLGMTARFDSGSVTVGQSEFFDFDYFQDQACKIFDVLRQTFEVKRVNAPSLQVIRQKGFEHVSAAEEFIDGMGICYADNEVLTLLGGDKSAFSFTVCTEDEMTWQDVSVLRRRRLDVKTVLQERQPAFDQRLVQRARLLPKRQRDAMQALASLRRRHPTVSPVAAQFDVENAFETEFDTEIFDLPGFLAESWTWHEKIARELPRVKGEVKR